MTQATRTVFSTNPLEIATIKHPAGTPLEVSDQDAKAMIADGRATAALPGKALQVPDDVRASLPLLPPPGDEPSTTGVSDTAAPHADA